MGGAPKIGPTGAGAPPAPVSGGTLFGLRGASLRRLGVVLVVVGLGLFFGSFALPFFAIQNFMQDPFGPGASPPFASFFLAFVLGGLGIVLLGLGGAALKLGLVRPVSGYVVGEAAPAIRMGAEVVGTGLREGWGATPAAPATVVKVKCKSCGYLDTEDATYCSKCGQPL